MSVAESQGAWRFAGLALAALLLFSLLLYRDTVFYLTGLWNQLKTGEYAHGYLVLAISAYLIWHNRQALSVLKPCPQYWASLAVLAVSLVWLMATLVDVQVLQSVGLLLLVLAVVWTVLGNRVTSKLLFPILFLGFAIPIWFPLSPLLQDLTADVVFWVVRALRIPAYRQEDVIVLPAGSLSIEEACSGLRYLLAALTLGTLYAYLHYQTFRARLMVVLVSAGAAVLTNILRVFIVVYLGYVTEMRHPLVADHLSLGWYLFGGLVIVLLILDTRLHRPQKASDRGVASVENKNPPLNCGKGRLQYLALVAVGAALISAGPLVVSLLDHHGHRENSVVGLELPSGRNGWSGPVSLEDDWVPEYRGAITRKQAYQNFGKRVYLYLAYYPVQRQGKELINDLNQISNKRVWRAVYPRGQSGSTGDVQILEQLLEHEDGRKRLVWYWYDVAGW
ncbi:MAG: EpsI family protein, partial [Gammaproteobacteria bacterium]